MNELPVMTSHTYASSTMPAILEQLGVKVNQPTQKEQVMSGLRVTRVYIADTNENLPVEKRILYSGDEKLTELTDQELFFECPIQEILGKHNEYRKTVVDKRQAEKFGRDIMLEPVRIKDLKMVVVTIAQF